MTQKPPFASMYLHTVVFYMHVVIEKNKQIYELHKTHLHASFKLHWVASKIVAFDTLWFKTCWFSLPNMVSVHNYIAT